MAKQYSQAKAIGNAGAFKFGELVARMFRWPVRLGDESTDLGVDAEIEVCDHKGKSTGKLIKAQIKTTEFNPDVGGSRYYLPRAHLDYLCQLQVPVILVYVDISAHSGVYWRPLNPQQLSKTTPTCFTFTDEDRLDASARSKLEALVPLSSVGGT
ncbi:DUF4365 domain-containing protein [Stutzerimonas nitrititolerans]|uniref:DUF4365 domain-containing protein n=1 Tax=Stutzerimonas nitrititolerans TaxID=2482751 RepID=UPI00289F5B33|nr:DUF4365 domain-containing protein [Stutzerimonas nitrititolerans]